MDVVSAELGARLSRRALVLGLLAALAGPACGSVPPLLHTRPSAEALGAALVEALHQRDRAALDALALNETEFRLHVWPQLPAARPERNLPFSYVWGDLHQKSRARLGATLAEHGGRPYHLVTVTFDSITAYGGYRVHRDAALVVRTPSGAETSLRVCGSMIEKDGAWKVFSYVIDD